MPIDLQRRNGEIVSKPQESPRPRMGQTATAAGHQGIVTREDQHPKDPISLYINLPQFTGAQPTQPITHSRRC